jgi:hypothetical protein
MGEMRYAFKILVGTSERNRTLRRPRHRWEDNIRLDPREVGWEVVDWMHLAEDRYQLWVLVNSVMSFRVL